MTELTDAEFLERFEAGRLDRFGHREHVRMAFAYVRRDGADAAVEAARRGIRAMAERAGAPGKYHETLTVAWVRAVAHFARAEPDASFEELLARRPQLLRGDLLAHHYSDAVLFSAAARAGWVDPDRVALPVR